MSKHTSHSNDLNTLAEDARELLGATVDVAGEKVGEARRRVAAALEKAKAGVQATDKAVHQNPYKAIAIGVGVGLLVGLFIASRGAKNLAKDS
jgi:ElaB/YqjD/DUF883 family membrane-anchored ribosome-binding protein